MFRKSSNYRQAKGNMGTIDKQCHTARNFKNSTRKASISQITNSFAEIPSKPPNATVIDSSSVKKKKFKKESIFNCNRASHFTLL
jgi:hypothetical protein